MEHPLCHELEMPFVSHEVRFSPMVTRTGICRVERFDGQIADTVRTRLQSAFLSVLIFRRVTRYSAFVALLKLLLRHFDRLIFLFVFLTHACSHHPAEMLLPGDGKNLRTVFIVHDAWHSAVVIRTADISAAVLPEMKDFPSAENLEFSWGDRDYFPAPDGGLGLMLKAAFWSSGSVLHVLGFRDTVEKTYPGAEIVEIVLSEESFRGLIKFISDTFS